MTYLMGSHAFGCSQDEGSVVRSIVFAHACLHEGVTRRPLGARGVVVVDWRVMVANDIFSLIHTIDIKITLQWQLVITLFCQSRFLARAEFYGVIGSDG